MFLGVNTMSESIIVALITGGLALIGVIYSTRRSNHEVLSKIERSSELSDEKLRGEINVVKADIHTLSDRVEKHNQMMERTYALERRMDVQEEKNRVANHRIDDLEKRPIPATDHFPVRGERLTIKSQAPERRKLQRVP